MKRKLGFILVIMFAAVTLFAETNLSGVYAIFDDDVLDFSEDGIAENIVDGKLVRRTMLDLKVGDVFIDTDGIAKKVANIERYGNEITIDTTEPFIEEFFQHVVVPHQDIDLTGNQLSYKGTREVVSSDGSIITMTSGGENCGRGNPAGSGMLGALMKGQPYDWTNISFVLDLADPVGLKKYPDSLDPNTPKKATKTGRVNVDVSYCARTIECNVGPSFEYSKPTIKWKKVWFAKIPYPTFTTGHAQMNINFDAEVGYALQLTGQGTIFKEFPLWGTPNLGGAYAYLFATPSASFSLSLLYQRYYRMTLKRDLGVEFVTVVPSSKVNKEYWNISASGQYFEGAIDADGEIMFGFKAGIKVSGFTVAEAKLQGGPYVNLHFGATWATLNWPAEYERQHRPDCDKYKIFMDDWKAHRLDEDLGTSFRATLGVKYSVNLTVLNFFNWTPVSGSWKIYEVGNHGTVLFGKPYGN